MRKNSKENVEDYSYPSQRILDLKRFESPELEMNVAFLTSSKFSLKEYGFKFRDLFSFNDPNRQVKDLWSWLKKLRNLKESRPDQAEILVDLRKYISGHWSHETVVYRNYTVLNEKLEIFEILGWAGDVCDESDRLVSMNKNIRAASPDFFKHISSFVLNFKFQKAIEEIEKYLNSKDTFHNIKELRFILEHLILYNEFFAKPNVDFASFEYKILARCILSIELETPYLKLIQIFLSKKFMEIPTVVMEINGINFFDRLLFVLRYQYKSGAELLQKYLTIGSENGNLDCLSMFSSDKNSFLEIMDKYLERTKDLVTIGLASIIVFEIFEWEEMEKYMEQFVGLLNQKNANLASVIYKEQLLLRKELKRQSMEFKKEEPNIIYKCYYCKKEPGKLSNSEAVVKSNCDLNR